jgi:HAMP domain-containing protein
MFANEELVMTHVANHSVPVQGKFRRALAAVGTFLQSLEYSSFDYTHDRIERLEREVGRLKEELRQSRDPKAVDASTPVRP